MSVSHIDVSSFCLLQLVIVSLALPSSSLVLKLSTLWWNENSWVHQTSEWATRRMTHLDKKPRQYNSTNRLIFAWDFGKWTQEESCEENISLIKSYANDNHHIGGRVHMQKALANSSIVFARLTGHKTSVIEVVSKEGKTVLTKQIILGNGLKNSWGSWNQKVVIMIMMNFIIVSMSYSSAHVLC